MRGKRRGGGPRPLDWAACAVLLAGAVEPVTAQTAAEHDHQTMTPQESMPQMTSSRMVLQTDDRKVFRLIRPAIAALQIKLAETGNHSGAINGLMGPSTARSLVAYQHAHGIQASGLPDLETVLSLMEWDGAYEGVLEHLDLESTTETMGGHPMDGGAVMGMPSMEDEDPKRMAMGGEGVEGDPLRPKSLVLMEMPAMVMDNQHTRAVRATREFVAALQLRLIYEQLLDGPARGLPQEPSFVHGITRYQESHALQPTGMLDLETTLELLGTDGVRLVSEYRNRIDLKATPVAMDRDLMRVSKARASTRRGGR